MVARVLFHHPRPYGILGPRLSLMPIGRPLRSPCKRHPYYNYELPLPVVSGFFLGTENGIDSCATDGALTLQGGFTVFHGYPLGVFHLALGFALDAIIQISHGEVASLRPF
jgi:hypothetical protein